VNKLWYECITAQKKHKCILRIPNSSINEEEATLFQHKIAIREIVLEYKNSKFVYVNYCTLLTSFYHRVVRLTILLRCEMKGNVKLIRSLCQIMNKIWFVHLQEVKIQNIYDANCNKSAHLSYRGNIQIGRERNTVYNALFSL